MTEKKKKSALREWWDSVLFAVIAATLIRGLFLEAYTIPTGSMEKTLLVNDFLFVSKVHYGARTPKTILQVPLTHQKIWFTDIPSYLDWIQLPNFRLPGFTSVKSGDVVVFNYPGNPYRLDDYGGFDKYPVDLRTNYIKRCIGAPGDVVEYKNGEVVLNGKLMPNPPNSQIFYRVDCKEDVNSKLFDKLGITVENSGTIDGKYVYLVNSTESAIKDLKDNDFVLSVSKDITPAADSVTDRSCFLYGSKNFHFSRDNFGPYVVPKKGVKIVLDAKNIDLYKSVITTFDFNEKAEYKDGKIFIDGKQISEYTFKQDYYFMMGDNRDGSDDSRYWGFVPADHIVGKAVFIWMSINENGNLFNKIRWNRLFNIIR